LQSPGSRRSVAPHRLCAPPPPRYSPALPRGCNRPWGRASRRPVGRLTPAPVRPQGAPSLPPGRAGRPLRGDRPDPPAKGTFPLSGPGRHALRGDCRGPPVFSFIARTRSDLASRGRTGSGLGMRCARQPPVTSFVGDRRPRASFFLVGATPARRPASTVAVTRPPLCSGRDTSPFRALALETAGADSRAPDGPSLRSRPEGRARKIEHLAGKRARDDQGCPSGSPFRGIDLPAFCLFPRSRRYLVPLGCLEAEYDSKTILQCFRE